MKKHVYFNVSRREKISKGHGRVNQEVMRAAQQQLGSGAYFERVLPRADTDTDMYCFAVDVSEDMINMLTSTTWGNKAKSL